MLRRTVVAAHRPASGAASAMWSSRPPSTFFSTTWQPTKRLIIAGNAPGSGLGFWSKSLGLGRLRSPLSRPFATAFEKPSNRLFGTLIQLSRRRFATSARRAAESTSEAANKEPQSLGARLRKLSKEYGWVAVGVYFGLTVLDFPFCFLLVQYLGTERIAELEHWIVSNVSQVIPQSVKDFWREYRAALRAAKAERSGTESVDEAVELASQGVKEAQERNKEEASLATQLAFAYAIHKSFIFVRVPLTAAITPKVVKILRSWGWKIGKQRK